MKGRLTQWSNPNFVKKSFVLSFVLSLIILLMSMDSPCTAMMLSVFAFVTTFVLQWIFQKNAFKIVVMDEKGIHCGKVFIEWHQVKSVRVFMAYARYPRSCEKVDETIYGKQSEYPIGTMIAINAGVAENILNFGQGIYISRTVKVDRMLKKYCRLYREYADEHTRSKISSFHKGKQNQYFWGNPRLFGKFLAIGFLFSFAVVFCWTIILFQLLLWKAIAIVILLCVAFVNMLSEMYRDAFLLIRVNEHGIFFDGMMIPWDRISDVREADVGLPFGFYHMDCGTVIAVNTEVGDRYLGRHVYDGVYFYKTKKAEKLFSKYLKDES